VGVDNPSIGSYARFVNRERILVTATPAELRSEMPGMVDVYDALNRQFSGLTRSSSARRMSCAATSWRCSRARSSSERPLVVADLTAPSTLLRST
jgi:hypothetical protein